MSRRSIRSSIALASLGALLVSATALAKSPTIAFTWTGNHGDVVSALNPGDDANWDQPDGIVDGTVGVAVYWPGMHIRSAWLHRIGGGDWASHDNNHESWGIGVSRLANSPLVNAADSTFDIATDAKGWATFFLHVDNDPVGGSYFTRGAQFWLYLCTETNLQNCLVSGVVTIRGN